MTARRISRNVQQRPSAMVVVPEELIGSESRAEAGDLFSALFLLVRVARDCFRRETEWVGIVPRRRGLSRASTRVPLARPPGRWYWNGPPLVGSGP
nr:unnamed protein product [Digitaria exilis]